MALTTEQMLALALGTRDEQPQDSLANLLSSLGRGVVKGAHDLPHDLYALASMAGTAIGNQFFPSSETYTDPTDFARLGPMAALTVWHGTPHKWPAEEGFMYGRPREHAIKTGEGAAAYGHGVLYGAEARPVAEQYRRMQGAVSDVFYKGQKVGEIKDNLPREAATAFAALMDTGKADEAQEVLEKSGRMFPDSKSAAEWLKEHKEHISFGNPKGSTYKLDVPDAEVDKMLDWDKLGKDQPQAVKDALRKYHDSVPDAYIKGKPDRDPWPYTTGEQIYKILSKEIGDPAEVSRIFAQHGIPGIRYLDQGSRATGEGTRNFVIFSEDFFGPQGPGKVLGRE